MSEDQAKKLLSPFERFVRAIAGISKDDLRRAKEADKRAIAERAKRRDRSA